ncbi:unnamed protein product [Mycena citricolor]|uniref:Uncharacterized protein n=1 Tax=Mycena citricolor TaxID=2018698 RepID=A0AAD2K4C9_9AGAR|nr:unnamed protein product [Mycena citricolor]
MSGNNTTQPQEASSLYAPGGALDSQTTSQEYATGLYPGNASDSEAPAAVMTLQEHLELENNRLREIIEMWKDRALRWRDSFEQLQRTIRGTMSHIDDTLSISDI